MNRFPCTNRELLIRLIGQQRTRKLYAGTLTETFRRAHQFPRIGHRLLLAQELICRLLAEEHFGGECMASAPDARDYFRAYFAGQEHESMVVVFLDNQHRLIAIEEVSRGTIDGAAVYPREVVKCALRHNAAAIIMAHNHPSGVAEPSRADEAITRRVKEALNLIDVRTLDHIVVGAGEVTSLAERGMV